jgi:hypothetical protein
MPFYDVESYASQNPLIATSKGFPVATPSPLAAPSNTGNTLQPMNEISSRHVTQAMHESSYSDTCSYPSMRHVVGSPEVWDMAPSLYPYSSQMSSALHSPPVPGLGSSETDHAILTSVNSYPQDDGQWSTGYEYHQSTMLGPPVSLNQTTSPNNFHTGVNSDIFGVDRVLSSESTIDNSYSDPRG